MAKRGPKKKYKNMRCPNEMCINHQPSETRDIVANGTYKTRTGPRRKLICRSCGTIFTDKDDSIFRYVRKDRDTFLKVMFLALTETRYKWISRSLETDVRTIKRWMVLADNYIEEIIVLMDEAEELVKNTDKIRYHYSPEKKKGKYARFFRR